MSTDWHLVLSRDGTVLAAIGGAPASWVGSRIDARDGLPEDLRNAGRAALPTTSHAAAPVTASVAIPSLQRSVHVTVVDALPLRRAPTDLRALLDSTLEVMRRQAKAYDVTLSVIVDDHVPPAISVDALKIAWAVTVLVGNALRYVPHGSRTLPGGSIAVRVTYDSTGRSVAIGVTDDGCGVARDRLVGLFRGGPGQPRGGLGLPMVGEVVAAHGGDIHIQSETEGLHRGTTIRFTLPVS